MKIHNPEEYKEYEPIGDKVLVALPKVDPNELQELGGVLVPKDAADRKNPIKETVVTAVGAKCEHVHKGDTILWNVHTAQHWVPFGAYDLHFLTEATVIAVTKRAPEFPKPVS